VIWQKTAFWLLPEGLACAVGAKANVPIAGRHKIELKKICGGENKKYRRVGNECRTTLCPVTIWSVYFSSPVKMVCLCDKVKILDGLLYLEWSSYHWLEGSLSKN